MRTFTDLKNITQAYCGLTHNLASGSALDEEQISQDINNGIKMFRHGARVAFTQKTSETQSVAGQTEYLLPPDCLRVTTVRGQMGGTSGWNIPLQEVISEEEWLRLTMVPYSTFTNPLFYYIRGNDTLCVYPSPADSGSELIVNYEPKMPNLYLDDITSTNNSYTNDETNNTGGNPTPVTAHVEYGSPTVILSKPILNVPNNSLYFETTDGTDGNVYKVQGIDDDHAKLLLRQAYQAPGITTANATFRIGQSLDFPEEFQLAPAYFAAAQYYYKRKDSQQAAMYDGMFQQLVNVYKENYGKKTTRRTQLTPGIGGYSPFFMTPGPIPGE